MLNITVKLKITIKLNITAIIIRTLTVIIRTFKIINNTVIIIKATQTLIIITIYVCVSKLTPGINITVTHYIITTIIVTVIKKE